MIGCLIIWTDFCLHIISGFGSDKGKNLEVPFKHFILEPITRLASLFLTRKLWPKFLLIRIFCLKVESDKIACGRKSLKVSGTTYLLFLSWHPAGMLFLSFSSISYIYDNKVVILFLQLSTPLRFSSSCAISLF